MFRVPASLLDEPTATQFCVGDAASAWTSGEHTVIDLVAEDEEGAFEEDWTEGGGEGRLASIVSAHTDLASGDRRLLHLAWLLCVQAGQVPDDEVEPPVPSNLGRLNGALHSAATFLRIDQDLIAAAASVSTGGGAEAAPSARIRPGLAAISESDKDEMLLRVAHGDTGRVRAEILANCGSALPPDAEVPDRRTAGDLLAVAKTC